MRFEYGELRLGAILVALLSDLALDFVSDSRWSLSATIHWEYRPRMGASSDQQEHYQLVIPLESGDMYARVAAATGTSSGRGDGETVSLKGESQLWTTTTNREARTAMATA